MALHEPSRATRASAADDGGYASHYTHASALKPPFGARKSASSISYSNVAKETRDRIKRYDEQTKKIEEQEQQRMQQYKIEHTKQATEKRKASRLPIPLMESKESIKSGDLYTYPKEVKGHTGSTFTNILDKVYQEISGKNLQNTTFMDSCVPFLHSEAQGAKTFVLDENRAISETHQLAMCSVQSKLPPSKISKTKSGPLDRYNDKHRLNSNSVSDTSVINQPSHAKTSIAVPTVPPDDEYLNSANSNNAACLQKAIDDVRQLPTYTDSSDDEGDDDYYKQIDTVDKNCNNRKQQYHPTVKPVLTSSVHLEPSISLVEDHAKMQQPISPTTTTHEQLEGSVMQLSPILQHKETAPKVKVKVKSRDQAPLASKKVFDGLETVKLNRNLAKCTDEEEALKRELFELDKKLANYSIDTTYVSNHTGVSISIMSDYPPNKPSKTLEDLAYGDPDDDLTDEQRLKKRLDYLKHQQMHDSKAVKESLSNAAIGQYQLRVQNAEQLKTQQPDRRQPSANNKSTNKAQYSAIAPLNTSSSSSNINNTSNTNRSNGNMHGGSAQAARPIRRVMRRTSAKQNTSEPKPLPNVLTSSGGVDDSAAAQEVHVSNHQLLKSLFSGPLDASQGVGYGVLNVMKIKNKNEAIKPIILTQQEPDFESQVHTTDQSHDSNGDNDDEDNEVRIAVVNYQEHYNKKSVNKSLELQSQQDQRRPKSNVQSDSEQSVDYDTNINDKNAVKSVVRNLSREIRPNTNHHNKDKDHQLEAHNSSGHKLSTHRLSRRTTPTATSKNQTRPKSVTFTDEKEYIENNGDMEKIETPKMHYSSQHTELWSHHKEVENLDNEFLPRHDNLTVSDLLDDDCDALDDYDFST